MDSVIQSLRLEAFHQHLHQNRFKLACDYAVTSKYGQLHLLCAKVFAEILLCRAQWFGLDFTTVHTYE